MAVEHGFIIRYRLIFRCQLICKPGLILWRLSQQRIQDFCTEEADIHTVVSVLSLHSLISPY